MTEFYKDMEMVYKPEMERLRKDAARYQFLKGCSTDANMIVDCIAPARWDEAIDSAMQEWEIRRADAWFMERLNEPRAKVDGTAQEHPHTDQCGFDRDASISEDKYVCTCGYPWA